MVKERSNIKTGSQKVIDLLEGTTIGEVKNVIIHE